MSTPAKYCPDCGTSIDAQAKICSKCGVRQPVLVDDSELRDVTSKKIAAGICGILLGALGIHKFILGLTTPGIIMLLVSILTCGIGGVAMHVIGIVEGVIYLTQSDESFYQNYIVDKKGWF